MVKTILTRVIAVIGMILSFSTISGGLYEFDQATDGLGIFKGLFWLALGSLAFFFFIQDFREKKWPFEA